MILNTLRKNKNKLTIIQTHRFQYRTFIWNRYNPRINFDLHLTYDAFFKYCGKGNHCLDDSHYANIVSRNPDLYPVGIGNFTTRGRMSKMRLFFFISYAIYYLVLLYWYCIDVPFEILFGPTYEIMPHFESLKDRRGIWVLVRHILTIASQCYEDAHEFLWFSLMWTPWFVFLVDYHKDDEEALTYEHFAEQSKREWDYLLDTTYFYGSPYTPEYMDLEVDWDEEDEEEWLDDVMPWGMARDILNDPQNLELREFVKTATDRWRDQLFERFKKEYLKRTGYEFEGDMEEMYVLLDKWCGDKLPEGDIYNDRDY